MLDFLRLSNLLHELAGNLSGGQKKLLELGRAMMAEPQIILLDEPGAGVNPTLLGDLADMIERLNRERGYTFCIIEHNMGYDCATVQSRNSDGRRLRVNRGDYEHGTCGPKSSGCLSRRRCCPRRELAGVDS